MNYVDLHESCAALLTAAGLSGAPRIQPIVGGANNRVFHVEVAGKSFLLKAYFQHPGDTRDRLGTEFAFCRFAWDNGVRCVPQPFASDAARQVGLFEFVPGRRLLAGEVNADRLRHAIIFVRDLNRHKDTVDAAALPAASEACFSIPQHLQCVQRRIDRLNEVEQASQIDQEAADFINCDLSAAWDRVADTIRRAWTDDETILPHDRCLSPSDFGYHNALFEPSGALRFIDFEYAGWDDPAKLVCDFFCQPAVPVPIGFFEEFAGSVLARHADAGRHLHRTACLLPVYRIKWTCILLNEFLPIAGRRRRFASDQLHPETVKATQLGKARQMLHSVMDLAEIASAS
jgi:hypothetical protein